MSLNDWSGAFLLTQMIEVPIYLVFSRSLNVPRRVVYAVGASTITHPLIWFCLPWSAASYGLLAIIAETFAVVVEAFWGRWWGVSRPWAASFAANMASLLVGSLLRGVLLGF